MERRIYKAKEFESLSNDDTLKAMHFQDIPETLVYEWVKTGVWSLRIFKLYIQYHRQDACV